MYLLNVYERLRSGVLPELVPLAVAAGSLAGPSLTDPTIRGPLAGLYADMRLVQVRLQAGTGLEGQGGRRRAARRGPSTAPRHPRPPFPPTPQIRCLQFLLYLFRTAAQGAQQAQQAPGQPPSQVRCGGDPGPAPPPSWELPWPSAGQQCPTSLVPKPPNTHGSLLSDLTNHHTTPVPGSPLC
jgi:hypothetical protein